MATESAPLVCRLSGALSGWCSGAGARDDLPSFAALNADLEGMAHVPAPLTAEASRALAQRADAALTRCGWGLWALKVTPGRRHATFSTESPLTNGNTGEGWVFGTRSGR